jgi:hypothetical protein
MKNLLLLSLLFCTPYFSFAQNQSSRSKEIESYKIAYMTDKLNLSTDDAKVFWPIYTAFQNEQAALRKERMQNMISFRKIDEINNLSDSEVGNLLNSELNYKQKELNIEKKYFAQLKAKLPIKVVGKYYRAQETFKRELLTRFRSGRTNPSN